MFGVIAKLNEGKVEYVKAKEANGILSPVVGLSFVFINVITSPVKSFTNIDENKYLISTENSTYLCWLDEWDNIVSYSKDNGLPEPTSHKSGSFYFGFDKRF